MRACKTAFTLLLPFAVGNEQLECIHQIELHSSVVEEVGVEAWWEGEEELSRPLVFPRLAFDFAHRRVSKQGIGA